MTTKEQLLKNIKFSEAYELVNLVEYQPGKVISLTLAQTPTVSLTVFAFDAGEGLSTHSAPGDALVQVLDGEVALEIGGQKIEAKQGQVVAMPANIPHSVTARQRFKMLLTVIKPKPPVQGIDPEPNPQQ